MSEENAKLSLEKLRNTTEPELIKEIDENLSSIPLNQTGPLRLHVYYDELVRRDRDKVDQAMLKYTQEVHAFTRTMKKLTWVILFATVVGVFFTVLGYVRQCSISSP